MNELIHKGGGIILSVGIMPAKTENKKLLKMKRVMGNAGEKRRKAARKEASHDASL